MIQPGPEGEYNTNGAAAARQHLRNAAPAATVFPSLSPPSQPLSAGLQGSLTIYSAVAYWVDGDTLHYFTTGNTHNQASLSLIDRELTERLNRELGIDFKLPAAK